jgi:hypothetical protein
LQFVVNVMDFLLADVTTDSGCRDAYFAGEHITPRQQLLKRVERFTNRRKPLLKTTWSSKTNALFLFIALLRSLIIRTLIPSFHWSLNNSSPPSTPSNQSLRFTVDCVQNICRRLKEPVEV